MESQNIEYKQTWKDEYLKWICGFANARGGRLIHKDYTGVAIQMKIYNDHITLWNEGILPEGYTVETLLGEHSSRPRNKNIANVFYKAGFIEAWGRGVSKIIGGFTTAGFPAPKFEAACGGMLVNISRIGAKDLDKIKNGTLNGGLNDELNKSQQKVFLLIREQGEINASAIIEKLAIPRDTLNKIIRYLVDKQLIERRGSKKSGGYWFVNDKKE